MLLQSPRLRAPALLVLLGLSWPVSAGAEIRTVRRGDNVYSIARYFGVSQDSIYSRNPWLRNTGLRAGQELRLPPPTR